MSHKLLDHTEKGIVIFCGAGVSMVPPTCLPSWWEMNEQVVQALARQIAPVVGPDRAANWAKKIDLRRNNGRFPPEFQAEILAEHYGSAYFKVLECLDGDEPNPVHFAIAALAASGHVRAIVTSNFDRLLEVAFRKVGVPLDVCFEPSHFEKLLTELAAPTSLQSNCRLLKLHGSVDDHLTLVDTLAQRMRGLPPAICRCLQELLRGHYWLFLGYSGRDLSGNSQYLCLQSEAERAVGFCWLVRSSAKDEPIDAVVNTCKLYGDRAVTARGDLPNWFLEQFRSLLPSEFEAPNPLTAEELDLRKKKAAQLIVEHTREWSDDLGSVRSALALANILEQSVADPHAAQELLATFLNAFEGDNRHYVPVANGLVNLLARAGSLDEAMKLGEKALAKVSSDDEKNRVALLSNIGLIEYARGDYRQALERFQQAYDCSLRLNDDHRQGVALHNRAMALRELGRTEDAMSQYRQELEIVERLGDAIAQAQTLNNIGDLLAHQDRYDEAIEVLQRSIALRERLGDDRGVASCLGNIASVHHRRGDLVTAKSTYERISAMFERIGDRPNQIITILNLGATAQELNEFDQAEILFRRAIAAAGEDKLEIQRARGLEELGSLYSATKRTEEASSFLDEALEVFRKRGDKSREANCLNKLGILFWRKGQLDAARSAFEEAIALHKLLNQSGGVSEVMGNLALVHIDKGEPAKAMELLKTNLSIAEGLHAKGRIAHAHFSIGALLHNQGQIQSSLQSFQMAQAIYRELGQTHKTIGVLATMGEVCGRQGKITASLEWFDQAIALATSVEQKTNISTRLIPILQISLQNGRPDLAQLYVQRLESVGSTVTIEMT